MNWKLLIFFLVTLFLLLYVVMFLENRHEKTTLHLFGHKVDMNLGFLIFAVFLDGAILTLLLVWLLGLF